MKFLGKRLIALLAIVLLVLIAFYIVLQTSWGARQISAWVNQNTHYRLSFSKIEHNWSSPSHLVFTNVSFGRNGQPAMLEAHSVDIGLSALQFSQPLHPDTIVLEQGRLNLLPAAASLPVQSRRLQLRDMAINRPDSLWAINARQVNGSIAPWQPTEDKILGEKAEIELNAGSMTLNGIPASNVLVQGKLNKEQLTLSAFGADIAHGALTGAAQRDADGAWQINSLRLNNIRLQTDKSLTDFLTPITSLPALKIDRLEVTDARLEGNAWAATDLDLNLRNITLAHGGWRSDDGKLSLNASEFINGALHLQEPIASVDFAPQGVTLRQFSSRWEGGMVRASGTWLRESRHAELDELTIAGLEYTLPRDWKTRWMETLPEWLDAVTVKKFSANRNLIIDIDPNWPFQITSLDGAATDLKLASHRQWGIWSGHVALNAAAATFNRVDVRQPSISVTADQQQIALTELRAFADKGLLEATANISQTPQREVTVQLKGQNVPINLVQQWGWPGALPEGNGNLQLSATGRLAADAALKPTVNGSLQVTSANGRQRYQTIRNGVVAGTEPAANK